MAIQKTLLKLEEESRRQTAKLGELEIAVREQEEARNRVDQGIRVLELIQSTRPNIEVFASNATNVENHASVAFCFINRSDFSSHVSVESIEFREIGALGEEGPVLEPYFLGRYDGLGELGPGIATIDALTFKLKDLDRERSNFRATVRFRFSSLDFFRSETNSIAADMGINADQLSFSFTYTLSQLFNNGYFPTQSLRSCG